MLSIHGRGNSILSSLIFISNEVMRRVKMTDLKIVRTGGVQVYTTVGHEFSV